RADDAVMGVDQGVAAEARQLLKSGHEALVDLLDDLAGAALVDAFVASNRGEHCWFQLSSQVRRTPLSPPVRPGPSDIRGAFVSPTLSVWGLGAVRTLAASGTTCTYVVLYFNVINVEWTACPRSPSRCSASRIGSSAHF